MMRVADVVLTRASGALALLNRIGQSLTGGFAQFTHAMIFVGPDVLMDATREQGVSLRNVVHELVSGRLTPEMCDDDRIRALRATKVQEEGDYILKEDELGKFVGLRAAQLRKDYNYAFLLPNRSDADSLSREADAAFCSELVALVLKPLGVLPTSWSAGSRVLPIDLQRLEGQDGWVNVTSSMAEELNSIKLLVDSSDPEDGRLLGERMAAANSVIEQIEAHRAFTDSSTQLDNMLGQTMEWMALFKNVLRVAGELAKSDPEQREQLANTLAQLGEIYNEHESRKSGG